METYRSLRALTLPGGIPTVARAVTGAITRIEESTTTGRFGESRRRILHLVSVPLLIGSALAPMAVGRNPLLGGVAVAGIAVLIVLATMPVRLTLLVVTLVPITSGLRRGLPAPGLRLSEALIAIGAVTVLMLPMERRPRWGSQDWAVMAFALCGAVIPLIDVYMYTGLYPSANDLKTAIGPLQFLLLYRVVSNALRSPSSQRMGMRLLLLASVPVSLLAIVEAAGPASVHLTLLRLTDTTAFNTNGYTAVPRASSVFPIWLALAGYLLVVVLLGFSLLLGRTTDVLPRWGLIWVIVVDMLAIVASLSLTVTAMVIVGGIYLGWKHGQLTRILVLLGTAGLITVTIFGSLITQRFDAQQQSTSQTRQAGPSWLPQTLAYRVEIWKEQYAGVVIKYAATGYGTGYPPEVDWNHTESEYITLMLRGGLPYLCSAGVLLYAAFRRARRELDSEPSPSRRSLLYAAQTLVLVQLPLNLTFPYLTASGMPQALWVIFGLVGAKELMTGRTLLLNDAPGLTPAFGITIPREYEPIMSEERR
jgi:hypothetical protein